MVLCKSQLSAGYLKQGVNALMESQDTRYPKYRVTSAAQNQLAVGTVWLLLKQQLLHQCPHPAVCRLLTHCSVEIMDVGVGFCWGEEG